MTNNTFQQCGGAIWKVVREFPPCLKLCDKSPPKFVVRIAWCIETGKLCHVEAVSVLSPVIKTKAKEKKKEGLK